MKILKVFSATTGGVSPFVADQIEALSKRDVDVVSYGINYSGPLGYLKALPAYWKALNSERPDVVHAHFGLAGLFACLQWFVPVVVTFHGADIYNSRTRLLSKLASMLSSRAVFVSESLRLMMPSNDSEVIPCGVDFAIFYPKSKTEARQRLALELDRTYVLFASSFSRKDKGVEIAVNVCKTLGINLLELDGYSRYEVADLMRAVDVCLLTSPAEGSPQFIKEALAVGAPIVASNVGDIAERTKNVSNVFLCDPQSSEEFRVGIQKAIKEAHLSTLPASIQDLSNDLIAQRLVDLYKSVTKIRK